MNTTLILFAVAAAVATFLGGMFSIRFKDKAHLISSFSAGVVIGLAFFDLLPESLELIGGENLETGTMLIATGFILYLVLDRLFNNHNQIKKHDHYNEEHIQHGHRGVLRASSLILHSFMDGAGIGFAFQVSTSLGILVAVAVLAHKFSDGINTVTAILVDGGKKIKAINFLIVASVAPILGIIFTMFFTVSSTTLGYILALFCGFFIYIGASDLIPESYHNHPNKLTTILTISGMLFMFVVISFAH